MNAQNPHLTPAPVAEKAPLTFGERLRLMARHPLLILVGVMLAAAGVAVVVSYIQSKPALLKIAVGPKQSEDHRLVLALAQYFARERGPIRAESHSAGQRAAKRGRAGKGNGRSRCGSPRRIDAEGRTGRCDPSEECRGADRSRGAGAGAAAGGQEKRPRRGRLRRRLRLQPPSRSRRSRTSQEKPSALSAERQPTFQCCTPSSGNTACRPTR